MKNELVREIQDHIESVFVEIQNDIHTDEAYRPNYQCSIDDDSVIVVTSNDTHRFADFDAFSAAFERGGFSVDDVFDRAHDLLTRWLDDTSETFDVDIDEVNDSIVVEYQDEKRSYRDIQSLIADYLTGKYFDLSKLEVTVNYPSEGGNYDAYDGKENFERFLADLKENLENDNTFIVDVEEDQNGYHISFDATYCNRTIDESDLQLFCPNLEAIVRDTGVETFENPCAWYIEE